MPDSLLGVIEVIVRAKLDTLDKDLDAAKGKATKAGADAGEKLGSALDKAAGENVSKGSMLDQALGDKMASVGKTLTKTLTPVAGAVAGFSTAIAASWNAAGKEIAVQTGATGAHLHELEGSMRNVAGTAKGSLSEIGNVISDIASKTALTGKPLEQLTRQFLDLKDLGISLSATDVVGTFKKWGVGAQDMTSQLDRLFKVAQVSAVPMGTLLERLAAYQPILKSLGFGFDEAAVLVSRLSDAMLPGLRKALGEIAKGTEEPKVAFGRMVAAIKNAATEQEALTLAVADFGPKGAAAWMQAIRGGKLDLDALVASVDKNTNSIHGTVEAHKTWQDQLGLIKERIGAVIAPFSNWLAVISTIAAGIGPMVQGGAKLIDMLQAHRAAALEAATATEVLGGAEATAGAGMWAMLGPIGLVVGAVALATKGFGLFGDKADGVTVKIGALARASNDQLVAAFMKMQNAAFGVEDTFRNRLANALDGVVGGYRKMDEAGASAEVAFRKIVESGDAGVAVGQRLIESLDAQHVKTGALKQILAEHLATQQAVTTATQQGAAMADQNAVATTNEAEALKAAKDAADTFKTALDTLLGGQLSALDETVAWDTQLRTLSQSILDGKASLDLHTEAGGRTAQSLKGLIELTGATTQTMIENRASVEDVNGSFRAHVAEIDTMVARIGGQLDPRLQGIIDRLHEVAAQPDITTFIDVVHTDIYRQQGREAARGQSNAAATGGLITSTGVLRMGIGDVVPGFGSRDTVPAMLTPGEFVINKASAARIGLPGLRAMNRRTSGQESVSLSAAERNGGGGTTVIVQPRAMLGTQADLKRWVREALDNSGRDNGTAGIR